MKNELERMKELSGINEDKSLRDKITKLALKYSEKQLASGKWKVETAQMFNKAAHDQPEDLEWLLKGKKMPSSFKF